MDTMFNTLLQLPLFQGLATEDLTAILGKTKLHFTKHKPDDVIVNGGTMCDRLVFILKGEVAAQTTSPDHSYSFTEYFQAPYLIEPQSLFGMATRFVSTYTANEETHVVSIGKDLAKSELFNYDICRINYMNLISNRAQNLSKRIWINPENDAEQRIIHFIQMLQERPVGSKILKIRMEDLAKIMNDTRTNVSKTLNSMQDKGMIELHRGGIYIPDATVLE